tara:strand:- start:3319 stop:4311 length:993 start_codon:yes stop_codon:yes gene_type:complete
MATASQTTKGPASATRPGARNPSNSRVNKFNKAFGSNSGKEFGLMSNFPDDLSSQGHWIVFHAYERNKLQRREREITKILNSIALPLPSTLKTGYKANYAQEGLGIMGMATAAGIDAGVEGAGIVDQVKAGIQGAFNKAATGDAVAAAGLGLLQNELAPLGAAALGNKIGGTVGTITGAVAGVGAQNAVKGGMAAGAGHAINPHMAQLFTGTGFRSHSFSYKFMPKDKPETDKLNEIIRIFKIHMHPDMSSNKHLFKYPNEFDIDFNHPKYLFNIAPSVLTTFDVDYHGEGVPLYHKNGGDSPSPASITISMSFTETTITTRDDIVSEHR